MDAKEIAGLGSELMDFLGGFDDCFGRSEPRGHLRTYVSGQLSDLPRKSVEPIALSADVPPRTLQRFLESIEWDEVRLRDKLQHLVARDHADGRAIGIEITSPGTLSINALNRALADVNQEPASRDELAPLVAA